MKYTSAWIIKDTRATSEPFPKQRRSTARAASRSRSGNPRVAPKWIVVFALITSTILLLANAFVCATWSRFSGLQGWRGWQIIPGSLALAFIPASILGMSYSNPALRIVYAVSASWLGALNFALWAAASCWIVDATAQLFGWPLARYDLAAALFGAAFLATGYGILNAAWLRVTRVTVQLPNLPQAWQGRTLALVTDLHLGHLSGPGFLRRVISKLRAAQPDAVLISGDMFDGT